jgi:hypothetical protein
MDKGSVEMLGRGGRKEGGSVKEISKAVVVAMLVT